ncbi:DUF4333 domain-containing protein [Pseudonocardia endophytica]|uniref:Uncharacterized protein DUF4190 n=1 Tax=Pseudonocardia endophytica TaxID=401976 RepID=A0A4R1HZ14_PSEEN|nr:DUF4333 domain-containing protein [Pseudonocardia endophytica]TCK22832.1 uncharacterized protein DUF4190 [Pseudonocardia endophytica]
MTQIQPPPAGSPYDGPPPGGSPYDQRPPAGLPYQGGPPPAGMIPEQQGMPPGYPYPPVPPPRRTNVLAIVSLVLAFLLAPIGLILGIVALVQIRKRGEGGTGLAVAGIVIGGLGTLIVAGIVAIALLATPTLNTDQIETRIASTTQTETGTATSAVTCPDSVDVQVGGTFTCTAVVEGQNLPFTVTQKDDQGNVDFQSNGWAATVKAEKALTDAATKNFPDTRWTATCADGKAVVVGGPGTTFQCTLAVVDSPAQNEQHTATITNAQGDVTFD